MAMLSFLTAEDRAIFQRMPGSQEAQYRFSDAREADDARIRMGWGSMVEFVAREESINRSIEQGRPA